MSEIPYSIRDKSTRINAIKGLNFDSIDPNELFKKQDANNLTGANLLSTSSTLDHKIELLTDDPVTKTTVGVIEAEKEAVGILKKLHLNTTGVNTDGITITSKGGVGIGINNPTGVLEVNGDIEGDNLFVETFGPTYTALPNLDGKIGQIVDAGQPAVTLVYHALIPVRNLTIPYTGVWGIDMSLFLGNAGNLTGDIKYPTSIFINGAITHNFYGTNVTGVNGSIKRNLNVNDVVSFHTYLTGTNAASMTASQRNVWVNGYTFLTARRIA